MDVNTDKFNNAYHHFKRLAIEAKRLGLRIQRCTDEMLEAINENGGEEEQGGEKKT